MTDQVTTTEASVAPLETVDTLAPPTTVEPVSEAKIDVAEPIQSFWYDSLADDLKSHPQLKDFKSLEEFVKSDINARKLLGKRVQDLKPEEVRQFLTPEELIAASRSSEMPASLDQYELNLGLSAPAEDVERLKKQLFDNGITPKQAKVLAEMQVQAQKEAREKTTKQWADEVYQKWGAKSTEVVDTAKRAMSEFASPKIIQLMESSGLGNNPAVIEFLANIGRAMMDHKVPHNSGHSDNGASLAAINSEIQSKLSDKKFYQRWQNQERTAVAELNALYARKYPLEGN